jgi:hypothetical protein
MLIFAISAAFAATDFTYADTTDGCVVSIGAVQADGTGALRADCHWADVDFMTLITKLDRFDSWHRYLDCLAATEQIRTENGRTLVWQQAAVPWPLATREDQVWMWKSVTAEGVHYGWKLADEAFAFRDASAKIPAISEGTWDVSRAADGGTNVVYVAAYNPGGNVPLALVRQYQVSAGEEVLANIHDVGTGWLKPGSAEPVRDEGAVASTDR